MMELVANFMGPGARQRTARVRHASAAIGPTRTDVSIVEPPSAPSPAHRSKPTLVLIHGLYSSPKEFALLARAFRNRQIDVDLLEVPGYSAAEQPAHPDWRAWVDAAAAALDARHGRDRPVVLGGLCVGGVLAAALAERSTSTDIVGLALLSPTFRYDGWGIRGWQRWRAIAYLLRIDRWISVPEREPFGIKDPKIRAWVMDDLANRNATAIGPERLSLRGIREAERLYRWVAARLPRLRMPTLVLHAQDDEIASLASVERAIDRIAGPCRLVVLKDSYHMITIDHDRHRVAHELADFVDAMAGPRHASPFAPVAKTPA